MVRIHPCPPKGSPSSVRMATAACKVRRAVPFSVNEILFLVIYFLLVSVCEEFVFRGYIGTRLNGLIKNKYVVLLITGILFVLMHFPYRMIAYNMLLTDLDIGWLINLFIFHFIMSFIYMKTNSIYGSIIPHWVSDLAYEIVSK